jgi:hypothetical protein
MINKKASHYTGSYEVNDSHEFKKIELNSTHSRPSSKKRMGKDMGKLQTEQPT